MRGALRATLLLVALGTLAGCGQKGPLYLPQGSPAAARTAASAPQASTMQRTSAAYAVASGPAAAAEPSPARR
ncbi:MAG: LPS translocon maturation chaperone LptM [Pseudomonadota bacterium]